MASCIKVAVLGDWRFYHHPCLQKECFKLSPIPCTVIHKTIRADEEPGSDKHFSISQRKNLKRLFFSDKEENGSYLGSEVRVAGSGWYRGNTGQRKQKLGRKSSGDWIEWRFCIPESCLEQILCVLTTKMVSMWGHVRRRHLTMFKHMKIEWKL